MPTWDIASTALFIFAARVLDVSLGTIRIALVSRGLRRIAPLVGFFEILCWLFAVGGVIQNLDRPILAVAFASGFATGTWLGMLLEERLAFGLCTVRIITESDAEELIEHLGSMDIGLTNFAARGLRGQVRLVLSVIPRKDLPPVLDAVRVVAPTAFVSVSDVRLAREGSFLRTGSQRVGRRWVRKK